LSLRGSRDFPSRAEYAEFLRELLQRRNRLRRERVAEEMATLRALPARRLEDYSVALVKVTRNCTVTVRHNTYSVPSQLLRELVEVRVFVEHLQVWYGGSYVQQMPRLRGEGQHAINYRHVIHSLLRKPGAFAHYRYQPCLFPRLLFRVAYDQLREQYPATAERQYVKLLGLAASESEERVEAALRQLITSGTVISYHAVVELCRRPALETVRVSQLLVPAPIELSSYDALLQPRPEVTAPWSL
jgi:hypothetical protein